ncbi:glucose-6-phosphate 1-epimerase [Bisgaardia hudsonensis]|uniref:Putative glucose-6-phosphate 1-epimerase n=1 Tax=Bisgaardia hudsonensis TaxID=109472 RepID=A0A4R2N164_9PAST|nr:D-hexose-6-phosphate mutarotase [Bisgaardia hudsonensis]QLB13173.1 D-hexose-6-phosphate mutarotase [Bisgaardia hudsonensis]TCP13253.1 glucose-6-phosphate 1-epimerase [Bisgaardia hudsonensis]
MTTITFLKQITPELSLQQYNEIPVIALDHHIGKAFISLQGAHLFSWQPKAQQKDVLWLSEIEPFTLGNPIRGGVPLCYPWFGGKQNPAHGYARNTLWKLTDYQIETQKVQLEFCLFSENHLIEAKINMEFYEDCKLTFTHYGQDPAEIALHSYFNIADIENIEVSGLPTSCFNSLIQQQETVPSTRKIAENVDCIYKIATLETHQINDAILNRCIEITHKNATETVLWNPWHKETSSMNKESYKTMVCVETARISQKLSQGEKVSTIISVK